MKKQIIMMIILIFLNIKSIINLKNYQIDQDIIAKSYICIALTDNENGILRKDVYVDDSFNVESEDYYVKQISMSKFKIINRNNKNFDNLNTSKYKIAHHKTNEKNKISMSEYIKVNPNYTCSINSYKLKNKD